MATDRESSRLHLDNVDISALPPLPPPLKTTPGRRSATITHDRFPREKKATLRVSTSIISPRLVEDDTERSSSNDTTNKGKNRRKLSSVTSIARKKKTKGNGKEKEKTPRPATVFIHDGMPITCVDEEVNLDCLFHFIKDNLTVNQVVLFLYSLRDVLPNFALILSEVLRDKMHHSLDTTLAAAKMRVDFETHTAYEAHLMDGIMENYLRDDFPELWKQNTKNIGLFPDTKPPAPDQSYMWFQVDADYTRCVSELRRRLIRGFMELCYRVSDPRGPPLSADMIYTLEH